MPIIEPNFCLGVRNDQAKRDSYKAVRFSSSVATSGLQKLDFEEPQSQNDVQ